MQSLAADRRALPLATVTTVLVILVAASAMAQTPCTYSPGGVPGTPDCNFGAAHTGLVSTALAGTLAQASDVAVQPDGRIVVSAYGEPAIKPKGKTAGTNFYVVRYNANGTLDSTFGSGGIATVAMTSAADSEWANAIALESVAGETRILIAGQVDVGKNGIGMGLARFKADGSLDTTFGSGGRLILSFKNNAIEPATDVHVQCDGRIVVAGASGGDMAVVRLMPNGALDSSFGTGGLSTVSFGATVVVHGLALPVSCGTTQSLVVVGDRGTGSTVDMAVARLQPNGALDPSFGAGGRMTLSIGTVDRANAVVRDVTDRIVIAGQAYTGAVNMVLARITPTGALDSSFGSGGAVIIGVPSSIADGVALDGAGRIVAIGFDYSSISNQYDVLAARYFDNGAPDTMFGTGGVTAIDFAVGDGHDNGTSGMFDLSGRLVVVGSANSSKLVAVTALNP